MQDERRRERYRTWATTWHAIARREILRDHPEVRSLCGPSRVTAPITLGIVALQIWLAVALNDTPWWLILLVAYCVGTFLAHGLGVLTHEAAHGLVFGSHFANKALILIANLPLVLPGGIDFRTKHLLHHRRLGEGAHRDFQTPVEGAIRWVGRSRVRKLIWLSFGSIIFPNRDIADAHDDEAWVKANTMLQLAFSAALVWSVGWGALLYLGLSAALAFGPHPLGMRGYAEHVRLRAGQPTCSYYGAMNALSFNVGYHVEHHDFPSVAWHRLPKLHAIAQERYEALQSVRGWADLLYEFLFDDTLRVDDYVGQPLRRPSSAPNAFGMRLPSRAN